MHDLSDGQRCNSEGQQFYTKDIVYAQSVYSSESTYTHDHM